MKKRVFIYAILLFISFVCPFTIAQAKQKGETEPTPGPIKTVDTGDWFIGEVTDRDAKIIGTVGSGISLQFYGAEDIDAEITQKWESSDSNTATVDEDGTVHCLAMSSSGIEISNTVSVNGEETAVLRCLVYISNPQIPYPSITVKPNAKISDYLTGTIEYSTVTLTSSNEKVLKVTEYNEIIAVTYGNAVVEINADGKVFKLTVLVSNPSLNTKWFLAIKGKTKQLSVKGKSGATAVTYKSSNSSVASVSKLGMIKAKKIGNANITIFVDGIKMTCVVNVTYKKALNVINSAKSVLGKTYSQARRMQKNYYDCSSLVWRMYKKQKVYFGCKTWAPTAAMEAQNMVKNKKAIAYKYVDPNKLLPGDVLFIKGKYNGRYRNICHTAIYIGNGTIIHATGTHVQYGTYDTYRNRITVIARPLK